MLGKFCRNCGKALGTGLMLCGFCSEACVEAFHDHKPHIVFGRPADAKNDATPVGNSDHAPEGQTPTPIVNLGTVLNSGSSMLSGNDGGSYLHQAYVALRNLEQKKLEAQRAAMIQLRNCSG